MNPATRLLRPYMARHAGALGGAALATIVSTAAALATPWPLKMVIDRLFAQGVPHDLHLAGDDLSFLALVAVAVVGIALADALATYASTLWLNRAAERIVHDLRVNTYAHLHRLALSYHNRAPKGDLVTRVTSDVTEVGRLFSECLGSIVSAGLLLTGMLTLTVLMDPLLAMAILGLLPILGVLTLVSRRAVRRLAREQRQEEGEIASLATEALSSVEVVKAFGAETFENGRVVARSDRRRTTAVRAARVEARFSGAVDVVGAAGAAAVIVLGVVRVSQGALTPGDLVVFAAYAQRTFRPLRDIVKQMTRASKSLARAERIAEVLATDEVLADSGTGVRPSAPARGDLRLDRVSFAYTPERAVLADVSLEIPAGTRLALVGPSGAGKSTICSLIARFHDPQTGAVFVDDRDLRTTDLTWLRAQIGILLQETLLLTGTVAENIAYGTEAPFEDVVAAAAAAGADEFIRALPDGYDTMLGHRGVGLSGGQRQRLGIARVLLRNPPILILDEPTTGLDAESESAVMDGLTTLMQGRTTIIVTHSGALALSADRVVVIDGGSVIQDGAPRELVERPGPFRRMEFERSLGPRRRRMAPRDPALPQMRWLLDPGAMTQVLERSLRDRRSGIRELDIDYARYRPGRRLTVRYRAEIDGRRRTAVATIVAGKDLAARTLRDENRALARQVNGRSPSSDPLSFDPDVEAMVQWLPLDLALPALAEPVELLTQRLGLSPGTRTDELVILSYVPRRRARALFGGHVLSAYSTRPAFEAAARALRALGGAGLLRTPTLKAAIPSLRLTMESVVPGRSASRPEDAARGAGELLAHLHGLCLEGLPANGRARQFAAAQSAANVVAALAPHVRPELDGVLRRLAESPLGAERLVPTHGRFRAGHLLRDGDGTLGLIDLDRLALGSPALDFASFAAAVVEGPEDLERAFALIDVLCEGYGRRPGAIRWHLGAELVRRTELPFQRQDEAWPQRTLAMAAAAAEVLG